MRWRGFSPALSDSCEGRSQPEYDWLYCCKMWATQKCRTFCYLRRRRWCFYFCLSVRRITEKVVNGFLRNFLEVYRAWPRDQRVQFWWRSGLPSGSRSPKSEIRIHWIIELPTDFDEILRRGLETNWLLHFGDDPHHYPDPGVRSGSRSGIKAA